MISKLTVKHELNKVEVGSVILSEKDGTQYSYLVVKEGGSRVRLIDLEKAYLYSHVHEKEEVINHIENHWDESVLKVFKKDEIEISEAK